MQTYFLFALYFNGNYRGGLFESIDLLPVSESRKQYLRDEFGRKFNPIPVKEHLFLTMAGLTTVAGTIAEICRHLKTTGWAIGCRRVDLAPAPEPLYSNSMAAVWEWLPEGTFGPLKFIDTAEDFLGWYGKELSK